jgi:beta-mannosidase
MRFLAGTFRMPCDLEEFAYLTQVMQGEAIKTGVLHWRSRMMRTAGALYWQLNDCWPVISWAAVDYRRRPKGLFYYTRRFFAPVAVRVAEIEEGIGAWVMNDSREAVVGEIVLQAMSADGVEVGAIREHIEVEPNGVYRAGFFKRDFLQIDDPARQFLVATFTPAGGTPVRDVWFIKRPKHMYLPDPALDWELSGQKGRFTIHLSAKAFAYGVYLRLPETEAHFSDNFLTLLPGESAYVEVKGSRLTASQAARRLEVKWVKGGL